jgi:hypothetical protein
LRYLRREKEACHDNLLRSDGKILQSRLLTSQELLL